MGESDGSDNSDNATIPIYISGHFTVLVLALELVLELVLVLALV
jgi:hypothetical protein